MKSRLFNHWAKLNPELEKIIGADDLDYEGGYTTFLVRSMKKDQTFRVQKTGAYLFEVQIVIGTIESYTGKDRPRLR